ncbi:MAG TPA: FAD-dependent oxidoreductase, partial [Rhizomicrobium sp.]
MQRALSRLSSEIFDVLIIGGGATGCFTARDAALRGLSVALIEMRDFASATSAHNSKLAHGGLRYLRNLEIPLVRESLRERLGLMRMAPHLVRPLPFLLPLYH